MASAWLPAIDPSICRVARVDQVCIPGLRTAKSMVISGILMDLLIDVVAFCDGGNK